MNQTSEKSKVEGQVLALHAAQQPPLPQPWSLMFLASSPLSMPRMPPHIETEVA
jgi:hypothetical protein